MIELLVALLPSGVTVSKTDLVPPGSISFTFQRSYRSENPPFRRPGHRLESRPLRHPHQRPQIHPGPAWIESDGQKRLHLDVDRRARKLADPIRERFHRER